ncbi:MAG: hypothetical protein ABFE07_22670 [Armatimonadia bacterium]
MSNIVVTIAVYEHIEFGYKTIFQREVSEAVESEGKHVRVSEWMTVAIPALPSDPVAAKVAALDSKAAKLRAELVSLRNARAKLRPANDDLDEAARAYTAGADDIDPETLQGAADFAREAAAEDRLLGGAA